MRNTVLICIPCLKNGGTEQQTFYLAQALVAGGYKCVTVCYFEYDFDMVQRFEAAGSHVECLSAYGVRPQSQRDVYAFLKQGLKRIVSSYHPAVAHIQYMAPGAMPIVILRRLGVRTLIATSHTDADIYHSLRVLRFLQRRVLRAFTCVSESAEKHYFGQSLIFDNATPLAKRNHFTIPNCLPCGMRFANPHRESATLTIGVVARLEHIKGADLVMPAFAAVLKHNTSCRLVVVGDGSLRQQVLRQQAELCIPDNAVEWTGRLPHNRLGEYYDRIDILWIPSRSEGFGLTAIEAMAHGCVVVAAATGGLVDIIDNGSDGFLFATGDSNDLADKTVTLAADADKLAAVGVNAVDKARRYDFDTYCKRVNSLYAKLLQPLR